MNELMRKLLFLPEQGTAYAAQVDHLHFFVITMTMIGATGVAIAAIFVLTPDGKVSRYLYGIDYPSKDLRLALVEAADGRVGTSFDRLLLTCYRYDPASRKYEPYAFGIVRAGGLAALLGLGGLIAALVWRERRGKARQAS